MNSIPEKDARVIWFVIGGKRFAGAEKRLLHTAHLLSLKERFDVRVRLRRELVCAAERSEPHGPIISDLRAQGRLQEVGCHPGASKIRKLFSVLYCWWSERRRYSGSLVHVALVPPYFVPQVLRARHLIYEVTGPYQAKKKMWRLLARICQRKLSFIAVSPNVGRILKSTLGTEVVRSRKAEVLTRTRPFVDACVADCDVSEKGKTVVFAHRLTPKKNPVMVAKVFVRVASDYPDWEFLIFGDGPLSAEVHEVVETARAGNVRFLGYSENLRSVLEKSLIFVSAISVSNYPSQSVFEALACKNAILLADDVGQDERLVCENNGHNAFITEDSIEAGLRELLDDEMLLGKAENSAEFFASNYSINDYMEEAGSFYAQDATQ